MADQKLTQLDAATTLADDDLVYVVDDVAGTPGSKKLTGANLKASFSGAYVAPGDDADTLGSGAASDGQVLTADGAGGAAWEAATGGGDAGITAKQAVYIDTPGLVAWDNFDRADGALGTAPSGQAWELASGDINILNGYARGNGTALLPTGLKNLSVRYTCIDDTGGTKYSCIPLWVDANNYVWLRFHTTSISWRKVVGGVETVLASASTVSITSHTRPDEPFWVSLQAKYESTSLVDLLAMFESRGGRRVTVGTRITDDSLDTDGITLAAVTGKVGFIGYGNDWSLHNVRIATDKGV